ncbi:RNA polymerase sigma factor [Luteococcus sp.]|uniref:RNA polymerase sigma factor n=1 Tax=Luteococcus sp. TaxID=1969402 RepID=UPI003736EB31
MARIDAEREARHQLECMASLPTGERELLELVAVDGLSVTEAARALGLRAGTARVRLHRARQHLNPTPTQEALPCTSH